MRSATEGEDGFDLGSTAAATGVGGVFGGLLGKATDSIGPALKRIFGKAPPPDTSLPTPLPAGIAGARQMPRSPVRPPTHRPAAPEPDYM